MIFNTLLLDNYCIRILIVQDITTWPRGACCLACSMDSNNDRDNYITNYVDLDAIIFYYYCMSIPLYGYTVFYLKTAKFIYSAGHTYSMVSSYVNFTRRL